MHTEGKVSANEQGRLIDKIGSLLMTKYIFPDVAEKIVRLIKETHKSGEYDSLQDPDQWAERLLEDLQSVSGDKHLRVFHDPEQADLLLKAPEKKDRERSLVEQTRNNFGFHALRILEGNIGYLDIRSFADPQSGGNTAAAVMQFLNGTDALIIDLRNSRGGSPGMVQLLCSYFFDAEPVHLNIFYRRVEDRYIQRYTLPYIPGRRRPDWELYILTSRQTWSAAEEFCYNLRHLDRATLIGEATKGGAHPCQKYALSDRFLLTIPQCRSIHPVTQTDWEGVGVEPHIAMPAEDALPFAHEMALENLVKKAPSRGADTFHRDQLAALRTP